MSQIAIAIFAHPDDIEFQVAGTLALLRQKGYEIHYLTLSSGNLGSDKWNEDKTKEVRMQESKAAALALGAIWHPPFLNDLEILYDVKSLRHLSSIIRDVRPNVIFTHSPRDYMEDHMCTSRLAVSAAFSRGMPNFETYPEKEAYNGELAIYHSQPHLNLDDMGHFVKPDILVNIDSTIDIKRTSLEMHKTQKDWLDSSQGLNAYIKTMETCSQELAALSKKSQYAEGLRRHSHIGFCSPSYKPLEESISHSITII